MTFTVLLLALTCAAIFFSIKTMKTLDMAVGKIEVLNATQIETSNELATAKAEHNVTEVQLRQEIAGLRNQLNINIGENTEIADYIDIVSHVTDLLPIRRYVLSRSQRFGTVVVSSKPVCDDDFDINDAKVACRMFGWSRAVAYKTHNFFQYGSHSGNFSLDDLECSGSESSLTSCPHGSSEDCSHGEEAGVICSN